MRSFLSVTLISTITLVVSIAMLQGYRSGMREVDRLFDTHLTEILEILAVLPIDPLAAPIVVPLLDVSMLDVSMLDGSAREAREMPSQRESSGTIRLREGTDRPPSMERLGERLGTGKGKSFFQVWDLEQRLLLHSENVGTEPLAQFREGAQVVSHAGYRWNLIAYRDPGRRLWLMAAEREDLRYELIEAILVQAIWPIAATIPPMALLIWWIISFGIRPLAQLAEQLARKEVTDLSPLAYDKVPSELVVLANSVNALLQRLTASFAREKRFAADAAHELRTPLAALKIHIDNLEAEWPDPPESVRSLRDGIDRMGDLVEQILTLNRINPELYLARFAPIDLEKLIREVIADYFSVIDAKQQEIELVSEPCWLQGDLFGIQTLIKNLLDNAIKYAPQQGRLQVRLCCEGESLVLAVIDNGPGIPAEERDRVFDRFYRVGGDRHHSGIRGCGLGLSIVRQIADLHHATLRIEDGDDGVGTRIEVRFFKSYTPFDCAASSMNPGVADG